jgi:hypothetical protein
MLRRRPQFSAETLDKPEKYIETSYTYNETLSFNGTFEPAFILTVVRHPSFLPSSMPLYSILTCSAQTSLDNINPESNEKYSKALFDFFKKKLDIPGDRGYMCVHPVSMFQTTDVFLSPAPSSIPGGLTWGNFRLDTCFNAEI